MNRREWMPWIAATVSVTALVHLGTLFALPRRIEARVLTRMGPPNTMRFAKRPDETSRGVVRPSPDLLYSACPFDLSKGPLKITARVPHSTYWSVSAFDAATNNFFVRDDQQIAGDSIEHRTAAGHGAPAARRRAGAGHAVRADRQGPLPDPSSHQRRKKPARPRRAPGSGLV
jgi:uncharacterized membrane protein